MMNIGRGGALAQRPAPPGWLGCAAAPDVAWARPAPGAANRPKRSKERDKERPKEHDKEGPSAFPPLYAHKD